MDKKYFIGIGKRGNTMVIEARENKDCLSCEIYEYYGQRLVTKGHLNNNRYNILHELQKNKPDVYGNLRYAVVD